MLQLRQSQSLQQRLTPQQVQYLKLLQLPALALEERIKAELEDNPMLEEATEENLDGEQLEAEQLEAEREEEQQVPITDSAATQTEQAAAESEHSDDSGNDYTLEDFMNDDTEGFKSPTPSIANDDREEIPHAADQSLLESLQEQLTLLNLPERFLPLADEIIGSIDEDGYLRDSLERIATSASLYSGDDYSLEEAEAVLKRIQHLDPVGVAARDLKECLLVQLGALPIHSPARDVARRIVRDRFDDFVNKRYNALAHHLGVEVHDLKEPIELIQRLNPKPGAPPTSLSESTNFITPDFFIERTSDGKEFIITLNDRGVPPLRINSAYKDLIRNNQPAHGQAANTKTREFIKKNFEAAKFFIAAIYQRRETMMHVMRSIVLHQERFFEGGEKFLKPLIYKTIAEDIKMDISTICRVVNGKYCQTDHGVFELKYFFSEAIPTGNGDGEAVANKVVKSRIKDIIDSENGEQPFSDERIVQMLNEEGFGVARRTVAKYREQMNIPVARLRKKIL